MAKNKNNKDSRISFNLKDFFVEKLKFENGKLYFGTNVRLDDICKVTNINFDKAAKQLGLNPNALNILDDEQVAELAIENGFEFEKVDDISEENVVEKINDIISKNVWDDSVEIEKKPPVITIMGHVDHGKTTLLDTIRKSNVTKGEAGGITQNIGAYQIEHNGEKLTFIDTPGHEAFTAMRANGSKVTDIAIIVVAADDSIMPQTRESVDHARAAGVPMIVAINKMDSVGANPDKVKREMMEINVVPEEFGGDVAFVEISALKGEGIDKLLENITLLAEILDLKAAKNVIASGTVIESNIHKQKGNLVTVLVQSGTLRQGDSIIIDDFIANVKAMHNDKGEMVKEALPGQPVEIFGMGNAPIVGSKFVVSANKDDQKIADTVRFAKENKARKRNSKSAADLFLQMANQRKLLNVIVKADALGVLEAIIGKVEGFSNDEVEVKIIRSDVGDVTNTDISLAEASKATIYTFNQKMNAQVEALAKNKQVNVLNFDIIYKLFEDIEMKASGMIEEKYEVEVIGELEVLQTFSFSKTGVILGCAVRKGLIKRDSLVEIQRNGKTILESEVDSLRIEKDTVKQATQGRECGLVVKDLDIEILPGDIIISKELIKQ